MNKTKQLLTLVASTTVGFSCPVLADADQSADPGIETITIIGTKAEARQIPGSGAVIDPKQMQIEVATDINQLLKTIPGTYIREEDGVGLRPNIGIRAATSGRSSKVTLLEDGVMIAPAPYSNPAAYYFPTTARMHSVEVLKGAPLLRHGPQTTGGVINLISTPIPESNAGHVTAMIGEHNSRDLHAYYGGKSGSFGWLVETAQRDSDGFKDIDRSGRDAGYDIEDYMVKLSWEGENQSLLFKAQYSEEISNETYLGLTDVDFKRDEDRRYGLSEIDQMDNKHESYNLVYRLDLTDRVSLTAMGYYNEFKRDWFKLNGSSLINAANQGSAVAQAVLDGDADYAGIAYTHGNRAYESQGLEVNFSVDLDTHQLQIGARAHEDEMDRFQPQEVYDQVNGSLVFQNIIQPTGGNNRIEDADALSIWITDNWQVTDALKVNLALRYEDVETSRKQYGSPDRSVLDSKRSNDSDELLPGASFTYDVNKNWQVLAGVHKGFAPPGGGAKSDVDPETSMNYEAGVRYTQDSLFLEAIGFYSDFDENNKEFCSLASPCSNGATSGSFTTGEAIVRGIELQASHLFTQGDYQIPVNLAYTHTDAELSDDTADGFQDGDTLANIPENTFSLRTGVESPNGWDNYIVAKYIDKMCAKIGCDSNSDRFDETESLFVVDFISRYTLNKDALVFLKVDNLFDEQSIVSRTPHGARPNKPRTAYVGVEYNF